MVAGLSTLAKDGQYYPESHPAYHVSLSVKMDMAHSDVQVAGNELHRIASSPLPEPTIPSVQLHHIEVPRGLQLAVMISMLHRSPPAPLN